MDAANRSTTSWGFCAASKISAKFPAVPGRICPVAPKRWGGRYVLSVKPNPAAVAAGHFDPERVRGDFRRTLDIVGDLPCELVFKDISTCRNDVSRLEAWVRIAEEEIQKS